MTENNKKDMRGKTKSLEGIAAVTQNLDKNAGFKHGAFTAQTGHEKVDLRTTYGKHIQQIESDLISDIGGNPSTQELLVICEIMKEKKASDKLFYWKEKSEKELYKAIDEIKKGNNLDKETLELLIELGTILGRNSEKRLAESNAMCRNLALIGLQRRAKKMKTLKGIIEHEITDQSD